jgi:hypothetical protein
MDAETLGKAMDAKLNVGLLLIHGSVSHAAQAFQRDVYGALQRAVALGYRPGMTLTDDAWRTLVRGVTGVAIMELKKQSASTAPESLARFWSRPAYLFLAACVKRGREFAETLRARERRLAQWNQRSVPGVQVLWALRSEIAAIAWLEGQVNKGTAQEALAVVPLLDRYEALVVVGAAVLRSEGLSVPGSDFCVEENGLFFPWLNTAVLKIANGDRHVRPGALSPKQALKACERLRRLTPRRVLDQVVWVVRHRVKGVPQERLESALVQVRDHLMDHIRYLRSSRVVPILAEHFIDPYLSGEMQVAFTHAAAMEYLGSHGVEDQSEDLPQSLRDAIEAAIDWSAFDEEEIQMMMETHSAFRAMVVRHLNALPETVCAAAVETLLTFEPQLVSRLIESGSLPWHPTLFAHFKEHLSPRHVGLWLRESLSQVQGIHEQLDSLVEAMLRLPREELRQLWSDGRFHDALVIFSQFLLFEPEGTEISLAQEEGLKRRVGEAFPLLALEAFAGVRAAIYLDREGSSEGRILRWEQVSHKTPGLWNEVISLQRALGKRLTSLLAAHSEEDCYRRLVAHKPDADELIAAFLKNRDEYYKAS